MCLWIQKNVVILQPLFEIENSVKKERKNGKEKQRRKSSGDFGMH